VVVPTLVARGRRGSLGEFPDGYSKRRPMDFTRRRARMAPVVDATIFVDSLGMGA
jgi:hypothetical protein